MSSEEIFQAIDDVTVEMIENVKDGKMDKIVELMKIREKQIEALNNSKGVVSEALKSKLTIDLKIFDDEYNLKMKKLDQKIFEISKALENLQSYTTQDNSRIFDERR